MPRLFAGREMRFINPKRGSLALVGVIAVAAAQVLIFADALSFRTGIVKGTLIVARPVVNLRDKAAAKGKVVAKAERGETLSYLASSDGGYRVRAKSGTGWTPMRWWNGKATSPWSSRTR